MVDRTKRGGGRPSKFTARRARAILASVKAGNSLTTAARAAGVSLRSLKRWTEKARDPSEAGMPYRRFRRALKKAQALAEIEAVRTIRDAGRSNWVANAWWLERTRPDRFGKVDRL